MDRRSEDMSAASSPTGTLLLDMDGRIQACSRRAAALFGREASDLMGHPVTAFIPDLRMRDGTRGYNVAYANFWFSHRQWRTFRGVDGSGALFPVGVSLNTVRPGTRGAFLLGARRLESLT